MGCFDTILIPCPHCGEMYPAQSKSGECVLADYALRDAPEDVMADANRHAPFVCVMCKTVFEVDIQERTTVQLEKTAEQVREDMWDRLNSGDPSQGKTEVEAGLIATMASEQNLRGEPLSDLEEMVARSTNVEYRPTGVKLCPMGAAREEAMGGHDIGWAVNAMRQEGKRVARSGWNGKNLWIAWHADAPGGGAELRNQPMTQPFIYMCTLQGDFIPWLCSQADLLAHDWEEVSG